MPDSPVNVDVRTEQDGSVTVRPHGTLDDGTAVQFRQLLVHAVRKLRPLRLVVDLSDVNQVDAINLGTLSALLGLADDHHVVVFLADPTTEIREDLLAAAIPPQRIRRTGDYSHPTLNVTPTTPTPA